MHMHIMNTVECNVYSYMSTHCSLGVSNHKIGGREVKGHENMGRRTSQRATKAEGEITEIPLELYC